LKFGKLRELSFIGSADIIGTGITSIFWFFLASQISPEQYGEIFYYIGIAAIVAAFTLIGAQNTITVYSSKNIKVESTLYFLSLILGVIASFILMMIFYRTDIIFLLLGYVINTLAMGELLGTQSFFSYLKHNLIQKVLTLVLGILAFIIFGVDGIIFALAISYASFTIIIYNRFKQTKINFSLLKGRVKFIINNYIIEILTKSNSNLNRLFTVPLLGFAVLGNFSLAAQVVNVGLIFTVIIFKYTIPYDALGEENKKLKKVSLLISIVMAFLGALIAPNIIPIFFPEYEEVADVIRIISFSIIPMTLTKIYSSKLLGEENNHRMLYSKVVSMITFVFAMLVLSPDYGIIGLAISYLLSTVSETICLIPQIKVYKNKNI
jgi:O-antigen/teichoic acid export membrane protein